MLRIYRREGFAGLLGRDDARAHLVDNAAETGQNDANNCARTPTNGANKPEVVVTQV